MPNLTGNAERYRALFESMDEGFCIIEFIDGPRGPLSDYIHVEANLAFSRHTGIQDVVGLKVSDVVPDEAEGWLELYGEVLRTGKPVHFERELVAKDRYLEVSAFRLEPPELRQVAVLFKDVTDRARAEAVQQELKVTLETRIAEALKEREEAEAALRQAQKMEAVGQLTGGLAHDFNNLLAGISGSFEMIGARLAQGRTAEIERYLTAGLATTRRAAALTHRLLAFSRRQTLSPKSIVINRLLADFAELVRRTVGPEIDVETIEAGELWSTLVDANQLENALLNLCINARDAMPDGGKIMIETANRWLDERSAKSRSLEPGHYVKLCVSDTGTGIEKDVIDRVFDPFFTTKPLGQGTGLGLSMVYGFARQSHGHVRIHSEIGKGTMVCLYLPRHDQAAAADDAQPGVEQVSITEGAKILVVDDEPIVRMLIVEALRDHGFMCQEAADGPQALAVLESGVGIDLLITDVGLPGGLNGRQLAEAARLLRPELRILFITGYAENAVLNHDHIERGMEVLTKPFVIEELIRRVSRLLDTPSLTTAAAIK